MPMRCGKTSLTSDKTNDRLSLPHGEGDTILEGSLVKHFYERILIAVRVIVVATDKQERYTAESTSGKPTRDRLRRSIQRIPRTDGRNFSLVSNNVEFLRFIAGRDRYAAIFLGSDKNHASSLVTAGSRGPKYPSNFETGFHLRQVSSAAEAPVYTVAPIA